LRNGGCADNLFRMPTAPTTNPATLSVRLERIALGDGSNFGHDVAFFGMFREGVFFTGSKNRAASALMENGMSVHAADTLLDMIAEFDLAFDVRNGVTEML
jgi:hypothetical protein